MASNKFQQRKGFPKHTHIHTHTRPVALLSSLITLPLHTPIKSSHKRDWILKSVISKRVEIYIPVEFGRAINKEFECRRLTF